MFRYLFEKIGFLRWYESKPPQKQKLIAITTIGIFAVLIGTVLMTALRILYLQLL